MFFAGATHRVRGNGPDPVRTQRLTPGRCSDAAEGGGAGKWARDAKLNGRLGQVDERCRIDRSI